MKKNLGSLISSIDGFSQDGYTVHYENGDVCQVDEDGSSNPVMYSSEMQYICNNQTEELGWPEFIGIKGKCHYRFRWRSQWACSICRSSQIKNIASNCDQGIRSIANIANDKCLIYDDEEGLINLSGPLTLVSIP